MKPTCIVLTDAQQSFRRNLSNFLNSLPEIKIVAESCSGKETSSLASTYRPDILLIDIQLPDMDGIVLIKEIARRHPTIGILVLSHYTFERDIWAAIQAGAKGYLLKNSSTAWQK
jgi:two-component system, NarL family, response regulator